jgi:hypothetical protein
VKQTRIRASLTSSETPIEFDVPHRCGDHRDIAEPTSQVIDKPPSGCQGYWRQPTTGRLRSASGNARRIAAIARKAYRRSRAERASGTPDRTRRPGESSSRGSSLPASSYYKREAKRTMNSSLTKPTVVGALQSSRLLKLDDFEVWRRRGAGLLIFASVLVVAYWALWFTDRSVVASDHTAEYIAFEQSFPIADGWLVGAAVLAAIQLWRRRPSALAWVFVVGGAGIYLCAMDVLYDLEHGIYTKGQGGAIELAIILATAAWSIGAMSVGWHFRHELRDPTSDR